MKKQAKRGITPGIVGITVFILGSVIFQYFLVNFNQFRKGKFAFYEGPILPMTSVSGAEEIEVKRNVELDFSPYAEGWYHITNPARAAVTDTYTLFNPTGRAKTVELAYGFEGQMIDEAELIPEISVNGEPVAAELAVDPDVEDVVHNAGTWKGYRKAIEKYDHLEAALAEVPALNIPVKVYHFYDIACTGQEREPYVFLKMDFVKSKDTTLWLYNHKSSSYDARNGEMELKWKATPEGTGEGWLLVQGEDIPAVDPYGYVGYNRSEDAYTDTVTWEMETFSSTVGEMIEMLSKQYDHWEDNPDYPNPGLATAEQIFSGAMKRFAGGAYSDSGMGFFDIKGRFHEVVSDIGMMYKVFSVEIPAGETVEVTAKYRQECSEDMNNTENPRTGYDIATHLGSNLDIVETTVSVSNTELVRLYGENMGLDWEQGITAATLGQEERYYLDVIAVEEGP